MPSEHPSHAPEEAPKRRYRVRLEMEAYGKDGSEVLDSDPWETVEIEATSPEEAEDLAFDGDYGNRRPSHAFEAEEIR